MRDYTAESDSHGNGFSHKVETVAVPRKSQMVTALVAVSVLAGMYPYMDYISRKQHAVSIGQQFLFILIIMIYMILPLIAQETEKRQENEKLLKALNDQFEIKKAT